MDSHEVADGVRATSGPMKRRHGTVAPLREDDGAYLGRFGGAQQMHVRAEDLEPGNRAPHPLHRVDIHATSAALHATTLNLPSRGAAITHSSSFMGDYHPPFLPRGPPSTLPSQ